jgi:hypothetical protein
MAERPVRDVDAMLALDGEADDATRTAVDAALARDASLRGRADGLREMTELVRGHLEIAADAAEPRFEAIWKEIDKRLDNERAASPSKPPPVRAPSTVEAAPRSVLGRIGRWLDRYRGHLITGAVSAGAVAAIALFLRGDEPAPLRGPEPAPLDVTPVRGDVESLDVPDGTGTVFTIEDEDGDTTVIWIEPEDTVEGL